MSIGNDIVLCPLCDGKVGGLGCPLCKGTGLAFTWKVYEYNEKVKGGKEMNKIVRGQKYETVGGWDAVVIHVRFGGQGFYAIHKHESEEESVPIYHRMDGTSTTSLSVNERPCYGKHPADIILR